jgi:hypothetical protein
MDADKNTNYGLRARGACRRHKGGQGLGAIGSERDREAVVASGINPRALSKAERTQFGGRGNEYISVRCATAGLSQWRIIGTRNCCCRRLQPADRRGAGCALGI